MGELAILSSSGFRNSILELARHVDPVGTLDPSARLGPVKGEQRGWRIWRLFRRTS
jgi:hypothetical protein